MPKEYCEINLLVTHSVIFALTCGSRYMKKLLSVFGLLLITTYAIAAPKVLTPGTTRNCLPAMQVSHGQFARNPQVWDDAQNAFIYFEESVNGSAYIPRYVNIGPDRIPGSIDDVYGSIGTGEGKEIKVDGDYLAYMRGNSVIGTSLILYGLGADHRPGTPDDTGERTVVSFSSPYPYEIKFSLRDGLLYWLKNTISAGLNEVGLCDTRKVLTAPGGCSNPVTSHIPATIGNVTGTPFALRDTSIGTELQIIYFMAGPSSIGPFQTLMTEPNYGMSAVWGPAGYAVNINGLFLGSMLTGVNKTAAGGSQFYLAANLSSAYSGYTFQQPIGHNFSSPMVKFAQNSIGGPTTGVQAMLWYDENTSDNVLISSFGASVFNKLTAVSHSTGGSPRITSASIDGEITAFEQWDVVPSIPASLLQGIFASNCH